MAKAVTIEVNMVRISKVLIAERIYFFRVRDIKARFCITVAYAIVAKRTTIFQEAKRNYVEDSDVDRGNFTRNFFRIIVAN